jgi:hypothetical protein
MPIGADDTDRFPDLLVIAIGVICFDRVVGIASTLDA